MEEPRLATAREVVIAGFRITAALFTVGMGALLYTILAGSTGWALFWWTFVFVAVPGGTLFFFREAQFFDFLRRRGTDQGLDEPRYRIIAAGVLLAFLGAAAIALYSAVL